MKMESIGFFDEMVHRGMLFLSVHDAVLYIKMETDSDVEDPMIEKVCINDRICIKRNASVRGKKSFSWIYK